MRAGTSPESMASVSQECCLAIRPDKSGLVLVCVSVRQAVLRVGAASLQSSNICLGIDSSLIMDIAG